MRVIVTGATGFIGRALCKLLTAEGYEVLAFTRYREKAEKMFGDKIRVVEWDGKTIGEWASLLEGARAVVNLAGDNISEGRWTPEKKQKMIESRLNASRAAIGAIMAANRKPHVFVQGSAIGYYGDRGSEILDESSPSGGNFLARLTKHWELTLDELTARETRKVIVRTGLVLGKNGGAFPRILAPFRFWLGGYIGSGEQWISWIHIEDEILAIKHLIENEELQGVFNLTAPEPTTMKSLSMAIGRATKTPSWLNLPAGVSRKLFGGDMADETLLSSHRVAPKRLLESGYQFQFKEVFSAVEDLTQ